METQGPDHEKRKQTPRRDILRWGLLGAGALLGTSAAIYGMNQIQSPETSSERSNEFSKTPDWQQNFAESQTGTLDTTIWSYETSPDVPGYNDEAQGYTDWNENVRIETGVGLVIEAHKRDYQYPNDPKGRQFEYTSGRIDTRNSLSFEYGKVEATMKLPRGEGVWPAFWLLSGNEVHTIDKDFSEKQINEQNFYLRNGEIDVVEYYGNNPSQVEATLHTYNGKQTKSTIINDTTRSFHTYGAELTPDNLIITVDDAPIYTFVKKSDNPNDWPFGNNNQMYVLLNLAMGGPAGEINDSKEPWRLEVANIAFYDYTGKRP
jgi:beta-glucanase (GH16 family)